MKKNKTITIILSIFILCCSILPAFATGEDETSVITTSVVNFEVAEESSLVDKEAKIVTEENETSDILESSEENLPEETISEEVKTETSSEETTDFTLPFEAEMEAAGIDTDEKTVDYTVIKFSGLENPYTLVLKKENGRSKSTDTVEYEISEKNDWTIQFEGEEGEYSIKLKTNAISSKAGKIYDEDTNEVVKKIKIERTNGRQEINLVSSDKVTFSIINSFKENWFIDSLFIIILCVYIYMTKLKGRTLKSD